MEYEVNIDDTKDIIEALLNEPMDPKETYYGSYDEAKERIEIEIKLPQVVSKGRKMIEKMMKNTKQSISPLMLTEEKGDDIKDEDEEDDVEEVEPKEEKPPKKKGRVIITKTAKDSPVMFTRRSSKSKRKLKLGEEDEAEKIIFQRFSPTLQEILKKMEEGTSMTCFKSLKYETRNKEEKMKIEDTLVAKLGK